MTATITMQIELFRNCDYWSRSSNGEPLLCARGLAQRFNLPGELIKLTCYLSSTHVRGATKISVAYRNGMALLVMFNNRRTKQELEYDFYFAVCQCRNNGTAWIWFEYEEPTP